MSQEFSIVVSILVSIVYMKWQAGHDANKMH